MKIIMFAHFKEYHGDHEKFTSLYGFWGRPVGLGAFLTQVQGG